MNNSDNGNVNGTELDKRDDYRISLIVHELRGPLGVIKGWLSLLDTTEIDSATRQQAMSAINRNIEIQERLLSDLMDLGRLGAATLQLQLHAVDMASLVQSVTRNFQPQANTKNVQLQCDVQAHRSTVWGDSMRLEQVLSNLLTNALKFTPSGGRINVVVEEQVETLIIRIEDTGSGIAAEFLPHIFEPYRQGVGFALSRGGLGLGLTIVREVVTLHGGTVEAHSAGLGQGTQFTVALPLHSV